MSKPYTSENLPSEYPVDESLLVEAETTPGIDAHDRNKALSLYKLAIRQFKDDPCGRRWFACVNWERTLRGLVAEANLNRFKIVKPFHKEQS